MLARGKSTLRKLSSLNWNMSSLENTSAEEQVSADEKDDEENRSQQDESI